MQQIHTSYNLSAFSLTGTILWGFCGAKLMYYYYTYLEYNDPIVAKMREWFTRQLCIDATTEIPGVTTVLATSPHSAYLRRRTCHDGHARKDRASEHRKILFHTIA